MIMVVKHPPKVHSLLAVLEEPGMSSFWYLFIESGRYPTGAPSSGAFGPFPRDCPPRSPALVAISCC